jgi:hypothetical protein
MTRSMALPMEVIWLSGSLLTAIIRPDSKNGWEKSTLFSRSAVIVMPAKPISQFPDSTASSRSGTLVYITNSGFNLCFSQMMLATSMQKPLKSLKTRGGNSLTAILICPGAVSAAEAMGIRPATRINAIRSILFIPSLDGMQWGGRGIIYSVAVGISNH